MADSITEITSSSWLDRIISSIKGVLFGLVLFAASFVVLFWNEGRAVKVAKGLSEGASVVVSADAARVDPANNGKLVHLTGLATTTEVLQDPQFNVSANALRLARDVQMYQWKEDKKSETRKKLGGGSETVTTYTYQKGWASDVADSARFHEPAGHANPAPAYGDFNAVASKVTLGAFSLSRELVGRISGAETIPATDDSLAKVPQELRTKLKVVESQYYVGKDPASPEIGDLKIAFQAVKPTTISVVARQSGNGFESFATSAGTSILMLETGSQSAAEMFQGAQNRNATMTWILRGVGFLMMWFGLMMVLSPLKVVADVVPFMGDLLGMGIGLATAPVAAALSLVTIAIGWIVYRPLLGIGLLIVAAAAIVGAKYLAKNKKAARAVAAAV